MSRRDNIVKSPLTALVLGLAVLTAAPALAQTDPNLSPPALPGPSDGLAPPSDSLNGATPVDEPAPMTGELVPLPTAPPADPAAAMKLPDCAPPACGTPEIMAP